MAKKQTTEVANGKIRIRLKAYDPQLLEQSADKIVDTAKNWSKSFRTYSITNREGNRNNTTFSTQTQRFKRTIRNENTQESY